MYEEFSKFLKNVRALNTKTDQIVALKCQSVDASPEIQRQILAELSVLHKVI